MRTADGVVVDTGPLKRGFGRGAAALLWALVSAFAGANDGVVGVALQPPTSPTYGTWGWYDLIDVAWTGATPEGPGELRVRLGAVDDAGPGALGLRQPIVEVYLLGGAQSATLPGAGLSFPPGTGWSRAVRITGEGVWAWSDDGGVEPLEAALEGATVRVVWPHALRQGASWVAISGVFDPFSPSGWRGLANEASPWAFAQSEGGPPVVDVWPSNAGSWGALQAGSMPIREGGRRPPWGRGASVASMLLGLAVAIVGLVWRERLGRLRGVRRQVARIRRAARGG